MTVRILFLVVLLGLGTLATAQVDRATLVGTVSDPSGAVIPGATVEIKSADTGLHRDVTSGPAGNYTFAALPIGVYVVTASQRGFKTVAVKDVRLQVGDNRTLDISLQIATETTAISVEAQAAVLERESAAIGNVIGAQQVREMPLNGRSWAGLMLLAPGAVTRASSATRRASGTVGVMAVMPIRSGA